MIQRISRMLQNQPLKSYETTYSFECRSFPDPSARNKQSPALTAWVQIAVVLSLKLMPLRLNIRLRFPLHTKRGCLEWNPLSMDSFSIRGGGMEYPQSMDNPCINVTRVLWQEIGSSSTVLLFTSSPPPSYRASNSTSSRLLWTGC